MTPEQAKAEIEKGISAVGVSLGAPAAPFFRFPALQHPPELVTYLGERNIAMFSTDLDSVRLQGAQAGASHQYDHVEAEEIRQRHRADARFPTRHGRSPSPSLLNQLKANGYKVVHMRAKDTVKTIAQYDEASEEGSKTSDCQPASDSKRCAHLSTDHPSIYSDWQNRRAYPAIFFCHSSVSNDSPHDYRMFLRMPYRFIGYAIVSDDGMLADATGIIPSSMVVKADQEFFMHGLDAAYALSAWTQFRSSNRHPLIVDA